ncbi:MAG: hypothetical protein KL787_01605 [Taibaiella sp.]|nr:hypothetical protein [Taibaiella sp.]
MNLSRLPGSPGHTAFTSITDWYNVNGQTPEYFNICDTGYILCQHITPHPYVPDTANVYRYGVPTNYTGVTFVDSGDAFIGLLLYYRLNGGSIEDMGL